VKDLSLLLTGGRLADQKRIAIVEALNNVPNDNSAFELALQLILTTPEFHSTSLADPQAKPAPDLPPKGEPKSEYKAVIHLMLTGGCDSFNLLVPRNTLGCSRLRNEYDTVRGSIGTKDSILNTQLLPLEGGAVGQPCNDFGVHDGLPILQELYNTQDLLFLANTGVLTAPVTKEDFRFKTKTQLFAHNSMQEEVSNLDPLEQNVGTGSLGRMADALEAAGFQTGRTSISANPDNLAGSSISGSPIVTLDDDGVKLLNRPALTNIDETIARLNGNGGSLDQSGLYGTVWSSILKNSIEQTDLLYDILLNNQPETTFTNNRFKIISQLINTRVERGVDRDFFFVTLGGYDTHKDVLDALDSRFSTLNSAIEELVAELKLIGAWDDVTIVQTSDFGRTLTGNSGKYMAREVPSRPVRTRQMLQFINLTKFTSSNTPGSGTDHGWGGNYFVAGGAVRGKRILGQYPESLTEDGELILDRGRVIPTTSWDSVFNAIGEWLGIEKAQLHKVLPNRRSFNNLFSKEDMFN